MMTKVEPGIAATLIAVEGVAGLGTFSAEESSSGLVRARWNAGAYAWRAVACSLRAVASRRDGVAIFSLAWPAVDGRKARCVDAVPAEMVGLATHLRIGIELMAGFGVGSTGEHGACRILLADR